MKKLRLLIIILIIAVEMTQVTAGLAQQQPHYYAVVAPNVWSKEWEWAQWQGSGGSSEQYEFGESINYGDGEPIGIGFAFLGDHFGGGNYCSVSIPFTAGGWYTGGTDNGWATNTTYNYSNIHLDSEYGNGSEAFTSKALEIMGETAADTSNFGHPYTPGYFSGIVSVEWYQNGAECAAAAWLIYVYYGVHDPSIIEPTATPTTIPIGTGSNILQDGDMEQYPTSGYWFPTQNDGRYDFGRQVDTNLLTWLRFGSARCNHGFHMIGTVPIPFLGYQILGYADMRQRFSWPGGDMYFRYSIGAQDSSGYPRNVPYTLTLVNAWSSETIPLITSETPADWAWRDMKGFTAAVPAGTWIINVALGANHLEYDTIKIDDVYVSTEPVTETCQPAPIPATTTTVTAIPSPGTGTPTGPSMNLLDNCGFEQGNWFWDFRTGAQVIYGSTNNYGHMESTTQNPGISQLFYWPGGEMFVQFETDSNYNVYMQNVSTGTQYMIATGLKVSPSWIQYRSHTYVSPGSYRINLHFPAGYGPASYDNITVSMYTYGTCDGGQQATSTLRPSSTPMATATMFPTLTTRPTYTQQATITTNPGTSTPTIPATYTPWPTYTPFPTYTPYTPPAPTSTPRPQPTYTSFPTYTQQPTYTQIPTYTQQPTHTQQATSTTLAGTDTPTAMATYTPWATYTPGIPGLVSGLPTQAPPPQPPPAYYADCRRPQNGYDMADWLEYNRCVMLSYTEWSPNAQATLEAMPTLFAGHEPLGSLNEAQNTLNGLMQLLNSFNTGNSGLPGTNQQPNMDDLFGDTTSPWITGKWEFKTGTSPNMSCNVEITGVIGQLAMGFCWFFQILAEKGIMAWVQLFINIAAIGVLLAYIWAKFIDAGSGAA